MVDILHGLKFPIPPMYNKLIIFSLVDAGGFKMCVRLSVHLSFSPSVCLSVSPPVRLSVCLSVCLWYKVK